MTIILPEGTNVTWWKLKYRTRSRLHRLKNFILGRSDLVSGQIGRRKKFVVIDANGKKHKGYMMKVRFEPFRFDGPTYKDGLCLDVKTDKDVLVDTWNWIERKTTPNAS